jgi:hypothetical protein
MITLAKAVALAIRRSSTIVHDGYGYEITPPVAGMTQMLEQIHHPRHIQMTDLPLDVFQLLRIALLPWMFLLRFPDQLRMLLGSRPDIAFEWHRMTDSTRFKLDLWLHHLSTFDGLAHNKNRQALRNRDKQCIICDISARAYPPSVSKNIVARVGFCLVGGSRDEPLGTKLHRFGIDGRVVREVPIIGQENSAFGDAVATADVIIGRHVWETHGQDLVPAVSLKHASFDVG